MKIPRVYTGPDGKSHFGEIDVPDRDMTKYVKECELPIRAGFMRSGSNPGIEAWHPAPRRQFVITLKGRMEVEAGDGTKKVFGPGDIFLAEDTTGQGHISRVISKEPRASIFLPLKD